MQFEKISDEATEESANKKAKLDDQVTEDTDSQEKITDGLQKVIDSQEKCTDNLEEVKNNHQNNIMNVQDQIAHEEKISNIIEELKTSQDKITNSQDKVKQNGKRDPKEDMYCESDLVPLLKQPGHTSFLTFCFVPPGIDRPVPPYHCPKKAAARMQKSVSDKIDKIYEEVISLPSSCKVINVDDSVLVFPDESSQEKINGEAMSTK